ncbi:MAG: hypothetical protein Q7T82_17210 [Armatimonadota bacterium]|nr:hypothetical protein [Armatimonadota bacterium]
MQDVILTKVTRAIDVLTQTADEYEGLIPSILDLKTAKMMTDLPAPIPGQRKGDRSHLGSNLIHDETLLATMYALSSALNRRDLAEAADRYIKRFATHCTNTVTGLFPWGEHAYWHLVDDNIGNSSRLHDPESTNPAIHDHLRLAPVWLWEKLFEFYPKCVERFAEGLDYHWKRMFHPEYSRHGEIEVKERPEIWDGCSFDFPRHGGFYILDWAFAYLKTGRRDFREQIVRMLGVWGKHRYSDGLLPYCSRCKKIVTAFYRVHACGQTMGLAASLLDTARLLQDTEPDLASKMRREGVAYATAFVEAPHDLAEGVFLLGFKPNDPERTLAMPVWGSRYGVWPVAPPALLCLSAYRHTEDEKFLRWAETVGRFHLSEPFPRDIATPANDVGLALGLLADLYEITGDKTWRDGGLNMATTLLDVYMDNDIPRGAAGIDWYESQMGPAFLLHGLARIALLADGREKCPVEADYTTR